MTREYQAWQHAKRRCFTPTNSAYPDYGARGITMREPWASDFAAFLRDMGPCPPNHTIERIDNTGHYEPGNCRWATRAEQNGNTRKNVYVMVDGHRVTVAEACRLLRLKPATVYMRMHRGATPERALGL